MSNAECVLELTDLRRTFIQGGAVIDVLRGVSFSVSAGEVVALTGPSGAGKSTLLQLAGLLEQPDGGEIRIAGESCAAMSDRQRTRARREKLGFVYQFHHLLPEFSARENIMLPQMIGGASKRRARQYADDLLTRLDLSQRKNHRPAQMSGGEQQRVSIARALVTSPDVIFADEPTGELATATARSIAQPLSEVALSRRATVNEATHDLELAATAQRRLDLMDGEIVFQS